jgi:hypothetical protein
VNILQAMSDKKLFRPWFKDPATWNAWRAFLALLFNLPMDAEQTAIALACTGLETLPEQPFSEAWLVVGRRGGKSLVLAIDMQLPFGRLGRGKQQLDECTRLLAHAGPRCAGVSPLADPPSVR